MPEGRTLGKVRDYLASIYRKDISSGDVTIQVDGMALAAPNHKVLEVPRWDNPEGTAVRWEKFVEVNLRGRIATGIVWLLDRGDTANAGLVLTWRGKAIVGAGAGASDANDSFRPDSIYGRSNSFVSQRLMGELDVSSFPVTSTKDDLEWTEDEKREFSHLLREQIDAEPLPLIKMAQMYRKRVKPTDVKEDVETAGRSLVDALSSASPDDFRDVDFSSVDSYDVLQDQSTHQSTQEESPVDNQELELSPSSASFALPQFLPGMSAGNLVFLHDTTDKRVVRWHKDNNNALVIEINRASRFMENYASLPQFHLEPAVRMLMAFVLVEIELAASGSSTSKIINQRFNQFLNQSLGLPVLPPPMDENQ